LIDTFRTRVAVIELWEFAFVNHRARLCGRIAAVINGAGTFGNTVDDPAHFVQFDFAGRAVLHAALIWWRCWSWHTLASWLSYAIRRLIKELRSALARIALRKIVAVGIFVTVVFSKSTFIDEGWSANSARPIAGVWAFIDKVIATFALVRIGRVETIGIR
jgi:hypothetical protein